jgi:hypothetical protein
MINISIVNDKVVNCVILEDRLDAMNIIFFMKSP